MLWPHRRALGTEMRITMSQRHPWGVFLLPPSIMTSEELEKQKKKKKGYWSGLKQLLKMKGMRRIAFWI